MIKVKLNVEMKKTFYQLIFSNLCIVTLENIIEIIYIYATEFLIEVNF